MRPRAAIPSVWANMKIADLADESTSAPGAQINDRIRKVALDYNPVSVFTALIAVDSSHRTEGNEGITVPVSVPVPDGVRYDTTVPEHSR
jgi:Ca-activated chloride channel family protein